jgi:hypothetical protein
MLNQNLIPREDSTRVFAPGSLISLVARGLFIGNKPVLRGKRAPFEDYAPTQEVKADSCKDFFESLRTLPYQIAG